MNQIKLGVIVMLLLCCNDIKQNDIKQKESNSKTEIKMSTTKDFYKFYSEMETIYFSEQINSRFRSSVSVDSLIKSIYNPKVSYNAKFVIFDILVDQKNPNLHEIILFFRNDTNRVRYFSGASLHLDFFPVALIDRSTNITGIEFTRDQELVHSEILQNRLILDYTK